MTDTPELPPLPEPLPAMEWQHHMLTVDQARAYARAYAAEAVRVECARLLAALDEAQAEVAKLKSAAQLVFKEDDAYGCGFYSYGGWQEAYQALRDMTGPAMKDAP